jgi:hypothetical protein
MTWLYLCGTLRPGVEEAVTILIAGQCANFGAAEDCVTVAGYDVVGGVAEEFGQELQKGCAGPPETWELFQDEDGGGGAGEQIFAGEFVVDRDVDGVESGGVGSVTREDGGSKGALQRGEAEDIIVIAAENELDEAVAESADAVVENDGVLAHVAGRGNYFPDPAGCGPA